MIFSKWLLALGVCLVACVNHVSAQPDQQLTRPKVEGKVIYGSATFGDDIEHTIVGGAVRAYVTKRLSIEPEYLYLRHSDRDQDQLVQPNVAYDFTDPTKRVVAYGIAGVGVLHHNGRFFNFTTWTTSVGVGLKIFVTKRLFVSPELRVGREPTVRGTINVGYVFAGKR